MDKDSGMHRAIASFLLAVISLPLIAAVVYGVDLSSIRLLPPRRKTSLRNSRHGLVERYRPSSLRAWCGVASVPIPLVLWNILNYG